MTGREMKIFFLILVAITLVLCFSTYLQDIFLQYASFLGAYFSQNAAAGSALFVAVSAVSVLLSPFSSVPLVPSAISAWGSLSAFLMLLAGWIIGGIFAYYVGSFSREKIFLRFFSLEKVEYYKARISPRSQFFLVLLFRLAIPSEVAGYTLGVIRYNFPKYLLATIIAELPFAFFVVYSSSVILVGGFSLFAALIVSGVIIFFLLYKYFQQKIKKAQP